MDLSNALITINLDGIYDVSYKEENGVVEYKESTDINNTQRELLNLVDVDNTTVYTVGQLQTANLSMDGLHTRTFRWVLGSIDSSDYETVSSPAAKIANYSVSSPSIKISATLNQNDKFGHPPSF